MTGTTSIAPAPTGALSRLGLVSHSPLIAIRPRAPAHEGEVIAHGQRFAAMVEAFAPERIVFFTNNHFAGFHFNNMPAYCVGTACEAVADLGGTPGPIPVPEADAIDLVQALRAADFDPGISYRMSVDHAVSQPLQRLLGRIDRYPLIPVYISCFTPPYLRFGRSRRLGEAVGRWIAAQGKRTLVMGSGGLSHHPARYFPPMGEGDARVAGYQMAGAAGGTMTDAEWFTRFADMHTEGAQMVLDGRRTAADMRLNPAFDTDFLDRLCRGDLASMDDWDPADLLARAGLGALELHLWIAAMAAQRSTSAPRPGETTTTMPWQRFYAPTPEYGTAYGMVYSPA